MQKETIFYSWQMYKYKLRRREEIFRSKISIARKLMKCLDPAFRSTCLQKS